MVQFARPFCTTFSWSYTPPNLVPNGLLLPVYGFGQCIRFDGGTATIRLETSDDPTKDGRGKELTDAVRTLLESHQVLNHQAFVLTGPSFTQWRPDGRRLIGAQVQVTVKPRRPVSPVLDEADRMQFLLAVAPKAMRCAALKEMLASYSRAVQDTGNEFQHLYAIRDAAVAHFGGSQQAQQALGILRSDWSRFGQIINDEKIDQSRHLGRHITGRRFASTDEITFVRDMARRIIVALAVSVP